MEPYSRFYKVLVKTSVFLSKVQGILFTADKNIYTTAVWKRAWKVHADGEKH